MKRMFVALVAAVLLATTAQSSAPNKAERSSTWVAKSYLEILGEFFGLKPAGASKVTAPGRSPNMACQNCEEPPFQPSPEDCQSVGLQPGCSYVKYCRLSSDPRCNALPY